MIKILKEDKINQSIKLYNELISRLGDINQDLVVPELFAERNGFAYKTLMEELEAYLFKGDRYHPEKFGIAKAQLVGLVAKVTAQEGKSKNSRKFEEHSPYLAALAAYMIMQLNEALAILDTIAMEIIHK